MLKLPTSICEILTSWTIQSGFVAEPRLSSNSNFPRRFPLMISKSPSPSISANAGELNCLLFFFKAGKWMGYQSVPLSALFSNANISPERLPSRMSRRPSLFQSPLVMMEWRSLPLKLSILKKFLLANQS